MKVTDLVCMCIQEVSVKKAFGMSNMSYNFTISSGNERGGVSPASTETKQSIQLLFAGARNKVKNKCNVSILLTT